jgi:hypothetical protein
VTAPGSAGPPDKSSTLKGKSHAHSALVGWNSDSPDHPDPAAALIAADEKTDEKKSPAALAGDLTLRKYEIANLFQSLGWRAELTVRTPHHRQRS